MSLLLYTIVFTAFIKTIFFTINPAFFLNTDASTYLAKASSLQYVDVDSAWYYIEKAEGTALQNQSTDSLALIYARKGYMFYTSGKYFASIQQFEKAYQLFNESNNKSGLSYVLNGNGLIYHSQNEFDLAEKAFRQALAIAKPLNDSLGIARSLLNLGFSLNNQGRSEEALEFHQQGLSYLTNFPDHRFVLMTKNQLASDLVNLKRYREAEDLFLSIISDYPDINYWESSFTYAGLAKIALINKQFQEAYNYAKQSYSYAEKLAAFNDMQRATEILALASKELNILADAFKYSQINASLKDSLHELSKSQSLNYLQLQLSETDKQRINTAFALAKNQALFNSYIIISLLVITFLLIWAVYYFRKNSNINRKLSKELYESNAELQKNNIQLKRLNDEKVQLLSVISHDLKTPFNSMQQIMLLIQDDLLNHEDYVKLNVMLLDQFNKTSELMNEILAWANQQLSGVKTVFSEIQLSAFIEDTIKTRSKEYLEKNISINIPLDSPSFHIKADKDQLRIILQNIVHNAIKFSPENGVITISYQDKANEKRILIKDEGEGMEQHVVEKIVSGKGVLRSTAGTSNEKGSGLGLLLVKQFLVNNNGYLSVESELGKGSVFILHFPN